MCTRAQLCPVFPKVFPKDCDGHLEIGEHLPNTGCFYRIGRKLEKVSHLKGNFIRYGNSILKGTEHVLGEREA